MKFCPECRAILEDKKICECGYNVETGKIDQTIVNILYDIIHATPEGLPVLKQNSFRVFC